MAHAGNAVDQIEADLVLLSTEAVHSKAVDANLLAEFVTCPGALLLLPSLHPTRSSDVLNFADLLCSAASSMMEHGLAKGRTLWSVHWLQVMHALE